MLPWTAWHDGAALMCGCGGLDVGWITPAQPSPSLGKRSPLLWLMAPLGSTKLTSLRRKLTPDQDQHYKTSPTVLSTCPGFSKGLMKTGLGFFWLQARFLQSFIKDKPLHNSQGPHLIQPPRAGDSRVSPTSFRLLVLLTQHHQRHLSLSSQGET